MNYNVETLEILRQGREQVRREYEKLMTVAEAICNRAKMQETEYKRQLAKVDELCEKIRKMREGDLKRRLEQGLKRQQELTTKADTLIKKLVMNGIANGGGVGAEMLELSKREKDWFAEVSKVEQRVKGSSRDALDVRKESSSKFLNQIRMHVKEIENDKENETKDSDDRGDGVPKELRQKKIEMLNGMLDKEYVLSHSLIIPFYAFLLQRAK